MSNENYSDVKHSSSRKSQPVSDHVLCYIAFATHSIYFWETLRPFFYVEIYDYILHYYFEVSFNI